MKKSDIDIKSLSAYSTMSRSQNIDDGVKAMSSFALVNRRSLLCSGLSFSLAVVICCGIVRSAIVLSSSYDKMITYRSAKEKIVAVQALQDISDYVYNEGFARMKYLTSGLDPEVYQEMNEAVTNLDEVLNQRVNDIANVYYEAPQYKQYKCTYYRIRSNLVSRTEAVPLTQYRTFDERNINPWDDGDFFECLLTLLADIKANLLASKADLYHVWRSLLAHYLSLRGLLNFKVVVLYAFLTRELVLNKGSVEFVRPKDENNLEDGLSLSIYLMHRADLIADKQLGVAGRSAIDLLQKLSVDFTNIRNATKALTLVQRADNKYEMTAMAKTIMSSASSLIEEYMNDVKVLQEAAMDTAIQAIISESIKLFIFAIILPVMTGILIAHMFSEANRLQQRYEYCLERYADSCLAIFRLLPEPVAKRLNRGFLVKPEYYHNVTVFYSDIVGFTTICSKMSAVNVLVMLNNIYSMFDSRTSAYQCYKIETIGDAYVVASGVPSRNEDHAAEIASLALVLIEEVGMIKIPQSRVKIRIRIGINSGPLTAGIVGVKMLRYCLFGKTVLTANRMEATSEPQKIQISESTQKELDKLGGFTMIPRSESEWPNGQRTYWLTGTVAITPMLSIFKSEQSQDSKIMLLN